MLQPIERNNWEKISNLIILQLKAFVYVLLFILFLVNYNFMFYLLKILDNSKSKFGLNSNRD